ncbi:hypothetical protein CVT26_012235 [Gymnopilus dilepis]|uniref:Transmembrane protein n=1 Tax=Gymnopilus dilepis TaxID=231916 RepID=A0A409YQ82_9AGAR|nr:hypothetical protein CVT26_012235 [Gymnopilus dilepis]
MSESSAVLIGLEVTFACLLSAPTAILGAVTLTEITNISADTQHALGQTLWRRYVAAVAAGMMGGWVWGFIIFCCICLDPQRPNIMRAICFSIVLTTALWVIFLALSPWHPERNLPSDVRSLTTVRKLFRDVLALKCLVIITLTLFLALALTLTYVLKTSPAPTAGNIHATPSDVLSRITQDGLAEGQAQSSIKKDLETGLRGATDTHQEPISTLQTEDKSETEAGRMATMDGAG